MFFFQNHYDILDYLSHMISSINQSLFDPSVVQ